MTSSILVLVETITEFLPLIEKTGLHVLLAHNPEEKARIIRDHAGEIRAVLTRGTTGFSASDIDLLPRLEIISVIGTGYENVDLQAASARGIVVTNSPGLNASAVADYAFALLLSVVRGIPSADASIRRGEWNRPMRPTLFGKTMGILGLGAIGLEIALRAKGGFGMTIHYHNRHPRDDTAFTFHQTAEELAKAVDYLIVATPGGEETRHLVDDNILHALGPSGYLVNIARGSVIDTPALITALKTGVIAGAALDVFDDEPHVPKELLTCPNTVLTPHIAGRAPEAVQATVQLAADNLAAHFTGRPVLTPVI